MPEMLTVIRQTLRDRRTFLLAYCLGGFAFLWMYVAIYPAMRAQSAQIDQIIRNYPPALLKAFGIEEMSFNSFGSYLSSEMYSLIWPIMAICMLVSLAGGALAGEIESGTIELALSQPVSRAAIFWGRYLAGAASLFWFLAATVATAPLLAMLHHIDDSGSGYLPMFLLGALFGLAVLSVGFLCSAWFSEKGRVYFGMGSLLVVMYVLNVLGMLNGRLEKLQYLSVFHYLKPLTALAHAQLDPWAAVVFSGVTVTATAAAIYRFIRRDIAV